MPTTKRVKIKGMWCQVTKNPEPGINWLVVQADSSQIVVSPAQVTMTGPTVKRIAAQVLKLPVRFNTKYDTWQKTIEDGVIVLTQLNGPDEVRIGAKLTMIGPSSVGDANQLLTEYFNSVP